jgi:hypothetical protein
MPKINRIRITNFAYNNRHIIDETFDFYNGENALLSLANGGGKSVLVQTIFQPIIPETKLLGRSFSDFFIGKKDPVYIMIEWLLDEQAGYLLTGIGISSSIKYTINSEEDNLNLRFYTFTNHYFEANPFDIVHIPITEERNNGIVISGYSEFKKIFQNEMLKSKLSMNYYSSTKEDQSAYERKLNNYSISRNEWKELMVTINQAEHGVSEVFAQCKNSKQVMEQWVIKYIEKVLDKSSGERVSDHQKLEQMMNQVANDDVENESFISEYQEISKFIKDLKDIEKGARNVCDMLEFEEQNKVNLASAYHYFSDKFNEINDKEVEMNDEIEDKKQKIVYIKLEEKSLEIYKIEEEIQKLTEESERAKEQLVEIEIKVQQNQYELNLQIGAQEYEVVKEKAQEKSKLEQSLENASKSQEQLLKDMNQIKYSLKNYYAKEMEIVRINLLTCNASISQLKGNKNALNELYGVKSKLKDDLLFNKGKLNSSIEVFSAFQESVFLELGIELHRNPLLNELDETEIISIKEQYLSRIEEQSKVFKADQLKIEELRKNIEKLRSSLSETEIEFGIISEELFENKKTILEYESKKEKIQSIISTYGNDYFSVFNQESILRHLREQHNQWHQKALHFETEINELTKMINGLTEGISYIPASLVSVLSENSIQIYTGESYLRELAVESRRQIIRKNPLLPYGLIITEKEREQIRLLIDDINMCQLVPLFKHADKEMTFEPLNYHLLSNPLLLEYDQENLVKHVEMVEIRKLNMISEKVACEKTVQNYYDAIKEVESFYWTEDEEKKLYSKKARIDELLGTLKNDKENAELSREKHEQSIIVLKKECVNTENKTIIFKRHQSQFEEYLNKNDKYISDKKTFDQVSAQVESLMDELKQMIKRSEDIENLIGSENTSKTQMEIIQKSLIKNFECYKNSNESIIIDAPESDLIGKLEAYESKMTDEVSNIQERIKGIDKDINRSMKSIENLGLVLDEVGKISYSNFIEKDIKGRLQLLDVEQSSQSQIIRNIDIEIANANGRLESSLSDLDGVQKLEKVDIKGDFDVRKKKLKERLAELDKVLKILDKHKMLLSNMKERINGKIDNISQISRDVSFKMNIDDNLDVGVKSLISDFTEAFRKANASLEDFKKINKNIKDQHYVSSTVVEALKGVNGQIDNLSRGYDKYFYLIERIDFYNQQLDKMMKLMQTKIGQLDHSKRDLIEHAYIEAMRIYHEIPKIVDNSSIEIEGTRRKILDIQYDKIHDDETAKERIRSHIQLCLENITKDIKDKEDESKIKKSIVKLVSTKELLNVVSNLESYKVRAYKVDINESNRRMMSWEEIIVKNSGGEKFVAYFSLLVALISYSRKNASNSDIFKKKEESKVLIMDNPFGPITSGHLLKPMFDIAKKYDTQLICLSDIKESAVLNSFNLVYMIKIRENTMKQEYLEVQENNYGGFKVSEKLEMAYFYSKSTQLSLLE